MPRQPLSQTPHYSPAPTLKDPLRDPLKDQARIHQLAEELALSMADELAESKLKLLQQSWHNEWEQWRLNAERVWSQQLREKEKVRLRELEEEFSAKEKERSTLLARSTTDYMKLETKLRQSLVEVEAKERRLHSSEMELKQIHAQKLSELQLLQRRLREDSRHQIELEKQKRKESDEKVSLSEEACARLRRRLAELESDFEGFRKANRKAPEAVIRADLARVTGEKAEAEARVDKERAEKNQILLEKEKLKAHIHQLARALKREQDKSAAVARHEVEQLRVQFLAKEESFVLDGDRRELDVIRHELEGLRNLSSNQQTRSLSGVPTTQPVRLRTSEQVRSTEMGRPSVSELGRLRSERQSLIATGQYSVEDPVISQLDEYIRQAEIEGHG